jgi:hypothetical protein
MLTIAEFHAGTVTKLELLCADSVIGTATGFFLRHGEQWNLVTNWHVFSGRDPNTGQSHRQDGAVPDSCRFYSTALQNEKLIWHPHTLSLVNQSTDESLWKQHPKGQEIDIACIAVDAQCIGFAKDLLDPTGHRPNMWLSPGMDVLLPGYPLGLASNGLMPIWKRGSIASSLQFGHSMEQYFFVDTATRSGMSGAPCIAAAGPTFYERSPETGKMARVDLSMCWRFLGVYSGRKNSSDSFEAQIGVVWRENLALDVLANGVPGSYVLA